MENEMCTVRQFLFLLFTCTVGATLVWIQLIEKADRPKIRPMQTGNWSIHPFNWNVTLSTYSSGPSSTTDTDKYTSVG